MAGKEQNIRGAFGEAAHEPGVPEGSVGDEDAGRVAGLGEANLFGT